MNRPVHISGTKSAKWYLASGALLLLWTFAIHWAWWNHWSLLHGVPAFFLGLVILILAQAVMRVVIALKRHGRSWLLSRRPWGITGWAALFLTATVALFYSAELWRGKSAWANMARLAARNGEPLRLEEVLPVPVPDEENFARADCFDDLTRLYAARTANTFGSWAHIAYWEKWPQIKNLKQAPWLDQEFTDFKPCLEFWRGWEDPASSTGSVSRVEQPVPNLERPQLAELVLRSLAPFEQQIEEVRKASARPHSRFELDYSRQVFESNPYTTVLNGMTRILRVRACAALAADRTQQAFEDSVLALNLCRLSAEQPWPYSDQQRLIAQIDALQPVWEGLALKQWNETQLQGLQSALQQLAPLGGFPASARLASHALAGFCETLIPTSRSTPETLPVSAGDAEQALRIARMVYPRGWSLQDQAAIHLDRIRVLHEPTAHATRLLHSSSDPFFPIFIVPRAVEFLRANELFFMAQAAADLGAVSCALERFRLANGAYPVKLEELVPANIASIPADPISNQPLHYVAGDGKLFILYSVGANQTDESGTKPFFSEDSGWQNLTSRAQKADWVWRYPKE